MGIWLKLPDDNQLRLLVRNSIFLPSPVTPLEWFGSRQNWCHLVCAKVYEQILILLLSGDSHTVYVGVMLTALGVARC